MDGDKVSVGVVPSSGENGGEDTVKPGAAQQTTDKQSSSTEVADVVVACETSSDNDKPTKISSSSINGEEAIKVPSDIPETSKEEETTDKVVVDKPQEKQDDFVIFHCVSYLGAAIIKEPRSEPEIQKIMAFLNDQSSDKVITVSVSVDTHSDGYVIVYVEEDQQEISRFKINQIIFFARGTAHTSASACFAFTSSHGDSYEQAIFQCHTFRCDVPEAVGRVFSSFARAFESPPPSTLPLLSCSGGGDCRPGSTSSKTPSNSSSSTLPSTCSSSSSTSTTSGGTGPIPSPPQQSFTFEVSLEIREDVDAKGHYSACPRDKGFFKLRSATPKQIWLTIYQLPDTLSDLTVERCFGLLLSPGRHVRHSDMQLVEMISWSIGSTNYNRKSYAVGGVWDINDPAFEPLNQETPKDSGLFFTVAVDLVIKGIQEPIRFALETKAKVFPQTERFWLLGRKHHFTQQFELSLQKLEGPGRAQFQVLATRALGEVDKTKVNFNLNFTSFIRSASIGSLDLDTPTGEKYVGGPCGPPAEEESDDDEPLQSGMGEISKHCTDEQITAWSEIVAHWPPGTPRPKQLGNLVRAGIPDTIRGEMWLRLSECRDDAGMWEHYKTLLGKECENEEVILRDITRTFPANDYFKESGGKGQEQLHRISKGYAVHDTQVGYCQGISFIGAALLLQMPEEQAFSLLVTLMYNYQFRDLYRDGFDNLHLKLYQLDRLIEEQIPELWAHFQQLSIESHMYASQWFLTLFTAKFPLILVFRVIDLFLLEGTKTLFQVALALLSSARKDLLVLDFEGVLKYFRVSLPKKFKTAEAAHHLIQTCGKVKVKRLKRYEQEYLVQKEQEKNYVDPLEALQRQNKKLMEDMIRYESTITNLVLGKSAAEEGAVALEEELARVKISLKEMEEDNGRLREETNSVKELFQREVKQYDQEAEKKSNIIADYKRTCTNLSEQLERAQREERERARFFRDNLCEACAHFVSVAMNMVSGGDKLEGEKGEEEKRRQRQQQYSPSHEVREVTGEESVKMLENELAKTKIALAEAECRNDDLSHRLSVALGELEQGRSSKEQSGGNWLSWRSFGGFSGQGAQAQNYKRIGQSSSNPVSMEDCSGGLQNGQMQSMPPTITPSGGNGGKKQ